MTESNSTPKTLTQPRTPAQWVRFDRRCRIETVAKGSLAELDVVHAGIDRLREHMRAGTSCSTTHLLWFVESGRMQVSNERATWILGPGQFLIAPAGTAHWLSLKSKKATGVWFHLADTEPWQRLAALGTQMRQTDEIPALLFHMEKLIQEQGSGRPFAATIVRSYQTLIGDLVRRQVAATVNPEHESYARAMETLRLRISERPDLPWRVALLARELPVSASHFYKLARHYWHAQPMDVVTQLRLNRAQDYLVHTALTLEQIAERVGYQNAFAFSNVFRKRLGERPSVFRARQSGSQSSRPL